MSGIKFIYITKDCEVVPVSQPKRGVFKDVKKLSSQDVLEVMLHYETKDRKPSQLNSIHFDRKRLDPNGGYNIAKETKYMNINIFPPSLFSEIYPEIEDTSPVTIPLAPSIPNSNEKIAIYNYLEEKFPPLRKNAPIILESTIKDAILLHRSRISKLLKCK